MSRDEEHVPPRPEIKKLPRSKCARCGFEGVKPMVHDGRCVNQVACQLRRERNARRTAERGE